MRHRTFSATVILLGTVGLTSCRDAPTATGFEDHGPLASISDAVHEQGNPHFFWLPPMVEAPSYDGVFDGAIEPDVQICKWAVQDQSCDQLELYTTETGPGSETIRVVPEDEHYIVNWHTDHILDNFPLDEGEVYRIRVLGGLELLGYADVTVVNSGRDLKNVDTDEYVPLLDGRTLPIKFRIEEGALVPGQEPVTLGVNVSCRVTALGDANCWGRNVSGQLGDGTYIDASIPQLVIGGHTFQAVDVGAYHACGLTTDGDVYCWGANHFGQLGNGSYSTGEATPQLVLGGHTYQFITAGGHNSCGITTGGETYCWGRNAYGALGIGYFGGNRPTPQRVIGGHAFTLATIGAAHVCAITTGGETYCWGRDYEGQLGNGSPGSAPSPVPVVGGHSFQNVTAGGHHTCALTTDSAAYCWGRNRYGELGIGYISSSVQTPQPVTGGHTFQAVSCSGGSAHSCAIATGDVAYCWGRNHRGQLGMGSITGPQPSPQPVTGGHAFIHVTPGWNHSCGLTPGSDVYCWGQNDYGQLGDGTFINSLVPVLVVDPAAP